MRLFALALALLVTSVACLARADGDALRRLAEYVEIDTVNPPGQESRGVEYLAAILEAEGIPYETAESAPGRGNLWARLEGGDAPGLVLLHHIDVVPATADRWTVDPLRAVQRDGFLYGRGTIDTKSLGIMHLEAFLALHRSGRPLTRDVVYLATADEEAGGRYGAGWLVENRPELFENVGFLLNEGAWGIRIDGRIHVGVEVAQKVPVWLRLVAEDTPGHGSMPQVTSAPTRLVAALERIRVSPFEPRVVDPVRAMFAGMANSAPAEFREAFRNLEEAIADPDFLERLQAGQPQLHALLRNTCSLTMLSGSSKVNVVPPVATAELDCRILPDQDVDAFVEDVRARVADDAIRLERRLGWPATASSADTALFRAIEEVTRARHPDATVAPQVAAGFTDSHFFRELGITSYGYSPAILPQADLPRIHGNDERIGIETFEEGVEIMTEIVEAFATR